VQATGDTPARVWSALDWRALRVCQTLCACGRGLALQRSFEEGLVMIDAALSLYAHTYHLDTHSRFFVRMLLDLAALHCESLARTVCFRLAVFVCSSKLCVLFSRAEP
jgi:hypothetical protein